MTIPDNPTEAQVLAMIRFHETGAAWYGQHDQAVMERWSKERVTYWLRKFADLPKTVELEKSIVETTYEA